MSKRINASRPLHQTNFGALRLAIEYVLRSQIGASRRQMRKHGKAQIRELAAGIDRTGFNVPLLVDDDLGLVSGHARLAAAELLGLDAVPVIRIAHLSEEQLRLFAIFENRIAERAEWDEAALVLEFDELRIEEPELDLSDSGFAIAEIDIMTGVARTAKLSDFDAAACDIEPAGPEVTRHGDIWQCGRHRIICGDSTDADTIAQLVDGAFIRQIVTDPPFDLPTRTFSSAKKFGDFAMGAGEMGPAKFTEFLARFMAAAQPVLLDGALVYAFMDHRHIAQLLAAGEQACLHYVNLLVWVKAQAGQGSHYRSGHELVGVFRHGDAPARNNIMLGKHGRNRSNVLMYPGVRGKGGGGAKALAMHPTVKNVAMIADLLLDASAPGEAVLDNFGGSGTTLIAAEKTDRTAYVCELAPGFVDVSVRRYDALRSEPARLVATGQTFAEVVAERTSEQGNGAAAAAAGVLQPKDA